MKSQIQQMLAEAFELEGLLLLAEQRDDETPELVWTAIKEKIENLARLGNAGRGSVMPDAYEHDFGDEAYGVTGFSLYETIGGSCDRMSFQGEQAVPEEECADFSTDADEMSDNLLTAVENYVEESDDVPSEEHVSEAEEPEADAHVDEPEDAGEEAAEQGGRMSSDESKAMVERLKACLSGLDAETSEPVSEVQVVEEEEVTVTEEPEATEDEPVAEEEVAVTEEPESVEEEKPEAVQVEEPAVEENQEPEIEEPVNDFEEPDDIEDFYEEPEPADDVVRLDEMLMRNRMKNLRQAFSINDQFRFRRELFGNNAAEMTDAIHLVEAMESFAEAEEYFYGTLGWDKESEEVNEFMTIIKNHFA